MPIFKDEEERREYIIDAKKAMVKPNNIQGYIDAVNAFTIQMFESFGNVCCSRYDPATLDKMAYTEFVDCNFCIYFYLWCDICPVEYYSKHGVESQLGNRICNMVSEKTIDSSIDSVYFNEKVITLVRDGGITFMQKGGFDVWRNEVLKKLEELKDVELPNVSITPTPIDISKEGK